MIRFALLFMFSALCFAHNFPIDTLSPGKLNFVDIGLSFQKPIFLSEIPDGSNRLIVLEQDGKLFTFPKQNPTTKKLFLDVTSVITSGGELGLLGLAFDPKFSENRYFYLNYTVPSPTRTQIVRYQMKEDGSIALPESKKVILEIKQPFSNHNGGMLAFGPDQMLYIGMGDGGAAGDPQGHGQKTDSLLGKMLRIDVRNLPYTIPTDNPFVGKAGYRGEIWALGMRNPWRFSFDRETGALWAGDVGQYKLEEVDRIERGKNYGWNTCEGTALYDDDGDCPDTFAAPAWEYSHQEGVSITGGYVYRGSKLNSLRGIYLFGDYVYRTVWGLYFKNGEWKSDKLGLFPTGLASFGEDLNGELYAMGFDGNGSGKAYRIEEQVEQPVQLPETLTATGLFANVETLSPALDLVAYDVNVALWSDGAQKQRWLIPATNKKIAFKKSGAWEMPVGSALVKHFQLGDRRVETRVLVHQRDGWHGYTYKWRKNQKEADLLSNGMEENITFTEDGTTKTQTWQYPSRSDCLRCHTLAEGTVLGIRSEQLHRLGQIEKFNSLGLFAESIGSTATLTAYPHPQDVSQPLAKRARAYLAVNCANCHQPGGGTPLDVDLRFDTALENMKVVNVAPTDGDLGISGAKRLVTGNKEKSLLWQRIQRRDQSQMPPLASKLIDANAAKLIGDWIQSM